MPGEAHYCLDALLVPAEKSVTIFPFPKSRAEALSLPRKAVPSVTIKGPATVRAVLAATFEALSAPVTTKQLKAFPKDKLDDARDAKWMDLTADMVAFTGFDEVLAGSGEYDVKYVSIKG